MINEENPIGPLPAILSEPVEFLKEDFIGLKKYVPFDETPEVIEARDKQEKEAWREVYSFAHMVNKAGRAFAESDIINLCERFLLSKEKVKNVFEKVFRENADAHGIDEKPEIYKAEYFLKKNWEFAKNEVTQLSEYRSAGSNEPFIRMNVDTIYRKLQHANFKFSMDKLKSLLKSDFIRSYNPFEEYFENLPPWDYEQDYIGKLADYVKTTDQPFHVTQFRKMLVRCVGCALYGVENRFVYILVGAKQEAGKSTFLRFLNPFGAKYYTEAPIRDHKDTYFSFSENFIYNLEELASLSNMEVNQLKSIISMTTIKERRAYEVNAEEQPRRANFFGSTNKEEFLTDDLNTRWLCVTVNSIDWGYKEKIDINKVWAQAFALYHDTQFDQRLTAEEIEKRDTTNKTFEVTDVEKDLIKQCFQVADKNDPTAQFYSNPDIITTLSEKYQGKTLNSRFISKYMVQLGFVKDNKYINGHRTRGYYVKLKTTSGYVNEIKVEAAEEIKPAEKQSEFKF